MKSFVMLSFEDNGSKRDFYDFSAVEQAIADGKITADTPVTLYQDGQSPAKKPAGAHAMLEAYFLPDEPDEPDEEEYIAEEPEQVHEIAKKQDYEGPWKKTSEEPPVAEPEPEPEAVRQPEPTPVQNKGTVYAQQRETVPNRQRRQPSGVQNDETRNRIIGLILAAILAIAMVSKCASSADESIDDTKDPAAEAADAIEDAAAEAAAGAEAKEQDFYMARWTNVRRDPSTKRSPRGRIDRGEFVTGNVVPGSLDSSTTWFRISNGRFSGGYISTVNLTATKPMALDDSTAGEYRLVENTRLLSQPSNNAPSVKSTDSNLSAGLKLSVYGTVNEEYAEIELRTGGIGYVPWTAFGRNIGADDTIARPIRLVNKCPRNLRIAFTFKQNGEWRKVSNQNWAVGPRQSGDLLINNNLIEVSSAEIYYHSIDDSYNDRSGALYFPTYDTIYYGRQERKMRRAAPILSSDGKYEITFCSSGPNERF